MKVLVISVLVLMAVGSLTSLLWLGAAAYSWWRDRGLDPVVLANLRRNVGPVGGSRSWSDRSRL